MVQIGVKEASFQCNVCGGNVFGNLSRPACPECSEQAEHYDGWGTGTPAPDYDEWGTPRADWVHAPIFD